MSLYSLQVLKMSSNIHEVDLFTSDLYQFTCSYAYFESNKHEQNATFEIFFRKYPFSGKYVILGGIRSVHHLIQNLKFTEAQEQYLKSIFPHMKDQYFRWLKDNLTKSIKIKSQKQGSLVFAKQPLISYSGPLAIVQLLETPILNLVGFASLVATNASRMIKAVQPKRCLEFGTRRAQGPDGAYTASEFAYLGGFYGTSNITIGKQYQIPCVGTMSHAYVTSFRSLDDVQDFEINGVNIKQKAIQFKKRHNLQTHEGELASFLMYVKAFPHSFAFLIDSYSVLDSGILNAIIVSAAMKEAGSTQSGIRLDSGDLRADSIECRKIWNKFFPEGPYLTIIASDDLHQERLVQMQKLGNQIDIFAIGTNIATCKKQPALGLVCKLVELDREPKMKFSADESKATYPAKKSVYRVWSEDNKVELDFIALQKEEIGEQMVLFDTSKLTQKLQIKGKRIQLLNPYWDHVSPLKTLDECKKNYEQQKLFFDETIQLQNPKAYPVYMTQSYLNVFQETLNKNKIEHHQIK